MNRIGWSWRERDGTKKTLWFDVDRLGDATREETRRDAIGAGYPGHKGGWWNYFVDDVANWLSPRTADVSKPHERQAPTPRNIR